MKGYTIDFAANAVTITKEFQKRASDMTSKEYKVLSQLRADFPSMRVLVKSVRTRKNLSSRLTYDKMVKYLSWKPNAAVLLNMFTNTREQSKSQRNPYLYVKEWFLSVCPDYEEFPCFDKDGNIIARNTASVSASERAVA